MLFGIPLGVISAVRQNTPLDYVLRVISLSGLSLPSFWLGLLILMAFVHYFGWIPIYTTPPPTLWDELLLYSIPAAAVGFRSSALMMRLTRSSMLEVLRQDYIRTARAKGASYAKVNFVHALRNAVLPIVTIVGIEAAFLVGGLIVTETVFNIPGVARFLVEAIRWRDYPIVQNLVMFIAVVRGVDQLPDRHGLPRARSAHRVREIGMAAIDRPSSKARRAARAGSRRAGYLARRYPLGAAGAVIVAMFVADGALRAVDHAVRSDRSPTRAYRSPTRRRAPARRRLHGPRHVEPHRLRRAHLARGRRSARPRSAACSASPSGSPRAISAAGTT